MKNMSFFNFSMPRFGKAFFGIFLLLVTASQALGNENYGLCFTALADGCNVSINRANSNLQYCLSTGGTWQDLPASPIPVPKDASLYIRAKELTNTFSTNTYDNPYTFNATADVAVSGNVMYLLDPSGELRTIENHSTFTRLFQNNEHIVSVSEDLLPAETLSDYCYWEMFLNCKSLTNAPNLMASALTDGCYYGMFGGCSSLVTPPRIEAEQLEIQCCRYMFQNCTSLQTAPSLPAMHLASYCYGGMFDGCMSLVNVPELPATSLAKSCYVKMFAGCTSLENAPSIRATTFDELSCYEMFAGCTKLNSVKVDFTEWTTADMALESWLSGVASTGTFFCPVELPAPASNGASTIPTGWTVSHPGLCFTALGPNCNISLNKFGNPSAPKLKYWLSTSNEWSNYTIGTQIPIPENESLIFMASEKNNGFSNGSYNNYYYFSSADSFSVSGNVMYLLDPTGSSTTLSTSWVFSRLFFQCATLVSVSKDILPATTLSYGCYGQMFDLCTALKTAPALPATTLAENCYYYMFSRCSSLIDPPALPATSLAPSCYPLMFSSCSSLEKAPYLPATTLVNQCYYNMFYNCGKLNYVKVNFKQWPSSGNSLNDWLDKVASTGTFICPVELPAPASNGASTIPTGWTVSHPGLCFTAQMSDCYVCIKRDNTTSAPNLEFRLSNSGTWNDYTIPSNGTEGLRIPVDEGESVYFRAKELTNTFSTAENTFKFQVSNNFTVSGNVMYLLDPTGELKTIEQPYTFASLFADNGQMISSFSKDLLPATTLSDYCYYYMFSGNEFFKEAPDLPAQVMKERCYNYMFNGCTGLEKTPELPATTLANSCYESMFAGCSNLISAGDLMAPTAAPLCYNGMFSNCASLRIPPKIGATTLASGCYSRMFTRCSELQYAPELPAKNLVDNCYYCMFALCNTLTTAPELPATTLANGCYSSMFLRCENLQVAPKLPATDLKSLCYLGMFEECTNLKTPPDTLPATSLVVSCYNTMFSGCTSLEKAPVILAKSIGNLSCYQMFYNCTKLHNIQVSFTSWPNTFNTGEWVSGVAPTGTFTCSIDLPIENGSDRIPTGWTVKYSDEPLTFTAEEAGATVTLTRTGSESSLALQYKKSTEDAWTDYNIGNTISLTNIGDKVYFRATNTNTTLSTSNTIYKFDLSKKTAASGNIMSLLDKTCSRTDVPDYCFKDLFNGCYNLTSAPELPALTIGKESYYEMFVTCSNLKEAPAISATTLGEKACGYMFYFCNKLTSVPAINGVNLSKECYNEMFGNCDVLVDVPNTLPASELAEGCYKYMFSGCKNLKNAPALPAQTLAPSCYYNMFWDCTSLVTPPSLPATTLAPYCYLSMFYGCTSLKTAPELPATELSQSCYSYMFSGCSSLTTAPALPATELANSCYQRMFSGCTALTTAPALPETTLAPACYSAMFYECVELKNAPELPATELDSACYEYMFFKCNLTTAPELPATTLANRCYYSMFQNCSNLQEVPNLPATDLSASCYNSMFRSCSLLKIIPDTLPATSLTYSCYAYMFDGCSSLEKAPVIMAESFASQSCFYMLSNCPKLHNIQVNFTSWPAGTMIVDGWVTNVADTGTFICPFDLPVENGTSRIPTGWTVSYLDQPLTFTAEEAGATVTLTRSGAESSLALQYKKSTDDAWTNYTIGNTISLTNIGDKVYFRATNTNATLSTTSYTTYNFRVSKKIAASGNIMSLLDKTCTRTDVPDYCFRELFAYDCESLTSAPELPALTIGERSYDAMFRDCENLTVAPTIAATTVGKDACYYMFNNCKSLTSVPAINGINLSKECYYYMFGGCENLVDIPTELPATELAEACYSYMFTSCTNLKKAPTLPATELATSCYNSMFYNCTSLETPPTLPATALASSCYSNMFQDCKSLTTAPELPATTLAENCYKSMFQECTALTTGPTTLKGTTMNKNACESMFENCENLTSAPALPATQLAEYCYRQMFYNCKKLETAPNLPATELVNSCYYQMFQGCTALTNPPTIQATKTADYSCYAMFYGCSSLTTAPSLPATELAHSCYKEMFRGCTSLINPPALPATELAQECYKSMFVRCSTLVTPPTLPATQLAEECYEDMFESCVSMNKAPDLPATIMAKACYQRMFYECTGLNQAPLLHSESLNESCYRHMFTGCSALQTAPALPAKNLTEACYEYMFSRCTSLVQAPELPAENLARNCYSYMFTGCKNMTKAPELPATTLVDGCYSNMFQDDSSLIIPPSVLPAEVLTQNCYQSMFCNCATLLKSPKMLFTDWGYTNMWSSHCWNMFSGCISLDTVYVSFTDWGDVEGKHLNWLNNVAPTGVFICPLGLQAQYSPNYIPENWNITYINDPLCFTALKDGATIALNRISGTSNSLSLQYAKLGQALQDYNIGDPIALTNSGDKVFFRATNTNQTVSTNSIIYQFSISDTMAASGNIMSLLDASASRLDVPQSAFARLFDNCTKLVSAPLLPAETLANSCYHSMFNNCTALQTAPPTIPAKQIGNNACDHMFNMCSKLIVPPVLPCKKLASHCYNSMFSYCSNLITPPELPADTLAPFCYYQMFFNCSALQSSPDLLADSLADGCYFEMFNRCSNLSTVQSVLPATKLASRCYQSMFQVCASLETPPALPANTLAPYCYREMFRECSRLSSAPVLPAKSMTNECYYGMFFECGNLTQAPRLDATTLAPSCYYQMFYNCQKIETAPVLPANKLEERCYSGMFSGCTGLTTPPELNADTLANYCYSSMFFNCTHLTTPPQLEATDLKDACYNYMFSRSGIETAPELPAKTLSPNCYSSMFSECPNLKVAPELPATTLSTFCYAGMFAACPNLITPPTVLPADSLTSNCYASMFYNCTSIHSTPKLLFTSWEPSASYPCVNMFAGCSSLDTVNVAFTDWGDMENKHQNWLNNVAQTGVFIAPCELPEERGTSFIPQNWKFICTDIQFKDSVNIQDDVHFVWDNVTDSVLPIVTVITHIQKDNTPRTFSLPFCLSKAQLNDPNNPLYGATIKRYETMLFKAAESGADTVKLVFSGIDSIIAGLPYIISWPNGNGSQHDTLVFNNVKITKDTSFANDCFASNNGTMFGNVSPTDTSRLSNLSSCLYISDNGYIETFNNIDTLLGMRGYIRMSSSFIRNLDLASVVFKFGDITDYALCLTAQTAHTTIELNKRSNINDIPLQYSTNEGIYWQDYSWNDLQGTNIHLQNAGDKVYFIAKEQNTTFNQNNESFHFNIQDNVSLSGSLLSLLDRYGEQSYVPDNAFNSLFENNPFITSIDNLNLSAQLVGAYSYAKLFAGCTAIETTPLLPAITLDEGSYYAMFEGCTKLLFMPSLDSIETVPAYAFGNMFKNCTSLQHLTPLKAMSIGDNAYVGMFENCTAIDSAIELPALHLTPGCYKQMFMGCTNLHYVPTLPAKQLAIACYQNMFNGCTSLDTLRVLFEQWGENNATSQWLFNTSNDGAFIAPCLLEDRRGRDNIPDDWTFVCSDYTLYDNLDPKQTIDFFYSEITDSTLVKLNINTTFRRDGSIRMLSLPFNVSKSQLSDPEHPLYGATIYRYGHTHVAKRSNGNDSILISLEPIDSIISGQPYFIQWRDGNGDTIRMQTFPNVKIVSDSFINEKSIYSDNNATVYACLAPFRIGDALGVQSRNFYVEDSTTGVITSFNSFDVSGLSTLLGFRGYISISDSISNATYLNNPIYQFSHIEDNALCFTADTSNTVIRLDSLGTPNDVQLQYSLDNGHTWNDYMIGTPIRLLNKNDKLYLVAKQGNNKKFSLSENDYYYFVISNGFAYVSGNIMTLLNRYDDNAIALSDYAFYKLFSGCEGLLSAPRLPATRIPAYAYAYMFEGCGWLSKTPSLPATTLQGSNGYEGMFKNCASLVQVSELPANIVPDAYYASMFKGCKNLVNLPELLAMTIGHSAYKEMFADCKNLITAPALPATTLADYCYSGMFRNDRSLTTPPLLPADTLSKHCYDAMFQNCTSLTTPPDLNATALQTACYAYMFSGCSQLTAFYELPATTLADSCYLGMFASCTNLEVPPYDLLASSLKPHAYEAMFQNCTKLTTMPTLASKQLATACYKSMFSGCINLMYAVHLPASELIDQCYFSMFANCRKLDYMGVEFINWGENNLQYTANWLNGVSIKGIISTKCQLPDVRGFNNIPDNWDVDHGLLVLEDDIDPTDIINDENRCATSIQIIRDFLRNGQLNTISLPFDISSDRLDEVFQTDVTVYELTDANEYDNKIEVTISPVDYLVAGFPYFIKWEISSGDTAFNPIFTNVSLSVDFNILYSRYANSGLIKMSGTLKPINEPTCNNGSPIYLADGDSTNYIWACQQPNAKLLGFRGYIVSYDDEIISPDKKLVFATAFDHPEHPIEDNLSDVRKDDSQNIRKILEDGNVIIIKAGVKYNLLGTPLND